MNIHNDKFKEWNKFIVTEEFQTTYMEREEVETLLLSKYHSNCCNS
jgi:hypothetical protein